MSKKEFVDISHKVESFVQNTMGTDNFKELNQEITGNIDNAIKEVKKVTLEIKNEFSANIPKKGSITPDSIRRQVEIENKKETNKKEAIKKEENRSDYSRSTNATSEKVNKDSKTSGMDKEKETMHTNRMESPKQTYVERTSQERTNVDKKNVGKKKNAIRLNPSIGQVSSVLYTVFGILGGLGFGITALVFFFIERMSFGIPYLSIFRTMSLILTNIFVLMFCQGCFIKERSRRFKKYLDIVNGRNFCTIKELMERTGYKKRFLVKDLRKMIDLRMFVDGVIDDKITCLMLDQEAYNMYLVAKDNLRIREIDKEGKNSIKLTKDSPILKSEDDNIPQEVKDITQLGKTYIKDIKLANDFIHNVDVSIKLDRMEIVIKKIFELVEKQPKKIKTIQKFIDYYLPTTIKLLNAYRKFEEEQIQGETIKNSILEIEGALDTINNAFENLLDDMYEEEALDISADISVLETLLAQEGLSDKDFDIK